MDTTQDAALASANQDEVNTTEQGEPSAAPFSSASLAPTSDRADAANGNGLLIPVHLIRVRNLPNREASAFEGEKFELLKDSISAAGGNSIPIGVIKMPVPEDGFEFECVFGERRLRVCGELKLPVHAVVLDQDPSVPTLEQKLTENALRLDLSPYELGCQINTPAPDGKLRSLGRLAVLTGREKGDLSKVRRLAQLPQEVLNAFPDKTQLKFSHAKPLQDALTRNREAVLAEAKRIASAIEAMSADDAVLRLVAASNGGLDRPTPSSKSIQLEVDGQVVGRCKVGKNGTVEIYLSVSLNDRQRDALLKTVQSFLRKRVLKTNPKSLPATETAK